MQLRIFMGATDFHAERCACLVLFATLTATADLASSLQSCVMFARFKCGSNDREPLPL